MPVIDQRTNGGGAFIICEAGPPSCAPGARHDVYIYCDESDVAPFVNIIGTADKDNSEDVRYLITHIVELAEIASVKYLAKFIPQEISNSDDESDIEEDKVRVNIILAFMNNTMKYAFLDDFFPEEPPP